MSETDRRRCLKSTLAIGAVGGSSAHAVRQVAAQERPRPAGQSSEEAVPRLKRSTR